MTPEVVPEALKRFVSSNPADETGSDGALAEAVYGAALVQLEELKAWYITLPNLQPIYILLNVFYDLLGMCDFCGHSPQSHLYLSGIWHGLELSTGTKWQVLQWYWPMCSKYRYYSRVKEWLSQLGGSSHHLKRKLTFTMSIYNFCILSNSDPETWNVCDLKLLWGWNNVLFNPTVKIVWSWKCP